jgi:hypothetical protein
MASNARMRADASLRIAQKVSYEWSQESDQPILQCQADSEAVKLLLPDCFRPTGGLTVTLVWL